MNRVKNRYPYLSPMKTISYVLAATVVATLFACRKPTEACFKAPTVISTNTDAVFDASCSQNAGRFVWDFGDDTDSSTTSGTISHKYTASGTYLVTLGVQSADGKSSGTDKLIAQTSVSVQ